MNEPRYASLSSGLLARKGTAKPAMRPQGYAGGFDDLGWNDMGYGRPESPEVETPEHVPSSIAALTPAPRPGELDDAYGADLEEYFGETEDAEAEPGEEYSEPVEEIEAVAEEAEAPAEAIEAVADEPAPAAELPAHPVVAQRRAILEHFDEEEAEASAELNAAPAKKGRAAKAEVVPLPKRVASAGGRKSAFTLRLDVDRHLRLRLACAVTGRSAQQIVAHALDAALADIPEIDALAARAVGAKRN